MCLSHYQLVLRWNGVAHGPIVLPKLLKYNKNNTLEGELSRTTKSCSSLTPLFASAYTCFLLYSNVWFSLLGGLGGDFQSSTSTTNSPMDSNKLEAEEKPISMTPKLACYASGNPH